jgi:hypothetical protein
MFYSNLSILSKSEKENKIHSLEEELVKRDDKTNTKKNSQKPPQQ